MSQDKKTELERKLIAAIEHGTKLLDTEMADPVASLLSTRLIPHLGQIQTFCEIIERWNRVINLVGQCDTDTLLYRHILDSAFAASIVSHRLKDIKTQSWLDIGSGAGFPGIIIAIMFPKSEILLCEPRVKRFHFLQELRFTLELKNVSLHKCRLEDIEIENEDLPNIATTRATGLREEFIKTIRMRLPQITHFAELTTPNLVHATSATTASLLSTDSYHLISDDRPRCAAIWSNITRTEVTRSDTNNRT